MSKFKIFKGVYKSFTDAKKHSKGNIFIDKKYIIKTYKELKSSFKNSVDFINFTQRYRGFGNFLISAYSFKKKINIIDFGGGMGNGYYYLKKTIPSNKFKKINYHIVDEIKLIKKSKKLNKNIKYNVMMPKIKTDVFVTSSSIQYLDDLDKFLDNVIKLNPKYLIFFDVFSGNIPNYYTLQRYYNILHPHSLLNEKQFISKFNRSGYELIFKDITVVTRAGNQISLDMSNFPKKYRISNSKNFIFKKIKKIIS